jgi:autotransporter-associated beta strand protein/autotransporter passenger strand-loop-strand repeat protein
MRDIKIALEAFRLNFRFSSKILWPIFIFIGSLLEHRALAATISFVGAEEGSGGNGYAPQNWSNAGVAKAYDLSGEKYGTAGYYQIRPMAWDPGAASIPSVNASGGNDLGITAASNPTLYSAPVFLGSITGAAGQYVNYGGYSIVRGPDGSALYRQGSLSVSVNQGAYNTPSGSNTGYFGEAFSFAMGSGMGATFRIGVAVDTAGSGTYAPDYVSLYSSSTGTVYSSQLARNGSMDMAFFDVSAAAGESLSAAVWQLAGSQSIAPFGLITFDTKSYDFNVAGTNTHTNSAVLTGAAAALNKTSTGTLVLAGSNSYAGVTTIGQGRIVLGNDNGLGATSDGTVVASGAQLRLNATNNGLTVGNEALTISGDGLAGTAGGALRNAAGTNTWQGKVTLAADATIGTAGSTSLTLDVVSGNAVEASNRNLTLDGAGTSRVNDGISLGTGGLTKIGSGRAILAGNNSYSGATAVNVGTLEVASGGSIASSATTVNSGGTLDVHGTAGSVTVNSGGILKGDGTVSALTVASGGTLAPGNSTGILSTGSTTFLGSGNYDWEIDNFTGSVGSSWDFLNITGDLTISATSGSQFIIDVISLLSSGDTAGLASNFNDATNYTFAIATASGTINGYAANAFSINTAAFQNSFTGNWGTSLSNDGKNLNITYTAATAIPEPSSLSLMVLGLATVLAARRRQN